MTGEEGVRELAAIDERNFLANADADDALLYANAPSAFLALAYVLSRFVPEFGVTFLFASAIGLTMFWWKFLRWHQTYSEIQFPDELFTEAQYKVKRAGVLGLIGSTLLIAFIYTRFINV